MVCSCMSENLIISTYVYGCFYLKSHINTKNLEFHCNRIVVGRFYTFGLRITKYTHVRIRQAIIYFVIVYQLLHFILLSHFHVLEFSSFFFQNVCNLSQINHKKFQKFDFPMPRFRIMLCKYVSGDFNIKQNFCCVFLSW